jgi:hypothetical protein
MTFYPDLGTETMVASGDHVRAVGWLQRGHAFARGGMPPAALERLRQFARRWRLSTKELWWGTFRGLHGCEWCNGALAHGNFGVPAGGELFAAPEMIVHYVEAHDHAPPEAFAAAVLAAPLPGTPEYRDAVEPFRVRAIRERVPQNDDWKRRHPTFPGVRACVAQLRSLRQKDRQLGDLLHWELYANAGTHAAELVEAFRSEREGHLRRTLLCTIAETCLPEFLPLPIEQRRSPDRDLRRVASLRMPASR